MRHPESPQFALMSFPDERIRAVLFAHVDEHVARGAFVVAREFEQEPYPDVTVPDFGSDDE